MVGDKPKYELHFHTNVQNAVVGDSHQLMQIFESVTEFTPEPLHQLPAELTDFTGRQEELEQVMALLQAATSGGKTALSIITGMAGVGKSALAIQLAHQLKPEFPDAQLYVNLRGTESQSLEPSEVLAGFLRAWGVDEQSIPEEVTERAELYRSWLSGKRTLVILDNAHDSAQVRPLLPDSAGCAVLVTSRKRLAALEEAAILELSALRKPEALELFERFIGVERIQAELDAATTIIDLCGGYPLAIRITGSTLRNQRQKRLEEYAHHLMLERQYIAQLRLSHRDIRASLASSFKLLAPSAARLFRFLGLLIGLDFAPVIATALLESDSTTALASVQCLVDVQLLEPATPGRYRLHDLVRLFAKEQLAQEEPTEARQAARLRAARWYLEKTEVMDLALKPEVRYQLAQDLDASQPQSLAAMEQKWFFAALNWFQLERMNLLAAVEWAYQAQAWEIVVPLTRNLVNYLNIYAYRIDWERTHLLALEASQQLDDHQGEAQTLTNLGNVYALQGKWDKAGECYEQSLVIFRELGNQWDMAKAMGNLANVYSQQGNWDKAGECYEQSRVIFHNLKDAYAEAQTLANLGIFHLKQSHEQEAKVRWQEALTKLSSDSAKSQQVAQWLQLLPTANREATQKTSVKLPESIDAEHKQSFLQYLPVPTTPSEPLQPPPASNALPNPPVGRRLYLLAVVILMLAIALLLLFLLA